MRVLFVSPASELGGAERCLLDCIAVLRASHAVRVSLLTFADGPLVAGARSLGAETVVIEPPLELTKLGESGDERQRNGAIWDMVSGTPKVGRFLARLRGAIARTEPDVVHTNGMKAHLFAGMVSPPRARLVVHLHDFIGARRVSKWLLPALSRIRPRVVFMANSHAVAVDFARLAPSADVRTVYNVVDTEYFRPGPPEPEWLAAQAGAGPAAKNETTFGLVATYARWKGHQLFIEAAGRLRAAYPQLPLRFYVIGGPIYKTLGSQVDASELLAHARIAGIEASFGLVPFLDDIARAYRSLHVMVHASIRPEPFGRTIVEAMACGCPVLVARAGGAEELFQHGENALGYEPGNAPALAHAMSRMLDAGIRARLGRAAREHAVSDFGRPRLAQELLRVYSQERG
jgi:glycosyltransferase involved in cell wall biosynthesis